MLPRPEGSLLTGIFQQSLPPLLCCYPPLITSPSPQTMPRHSKRKFKYLINPSQQRKHLSPRCAEYPIPRHSFRIYRDLKQGMRIRADSVLKMSHYIDMFPPKKGSFRQQQREDSSASRDDAEKIDFFQHDYPHKSAIQHLNTYFSKKRAEMFSTMRDSELSLHFSKIFLQLLFGEQRLGSAERLLRHEFFLFHNWEVMLDLIRAYAHRGNLEKIEQLWMFYLEANRGRIAEDYDVSGLYSNRNWMHKLGKEMKHLKSIERERVDVANCLLHALMRRMEHSRGQELFQEWVRAGSVFTPNKETLILMMRSYSITRNPKEAKRLFRYYCEETRLIPLDAELVTNYLHIFVMKGDMTKAKKIFRKFTLPPSEQDEMFDAHDPLPTVVPDARMIGKMIQGYAMVGNMAEAKRWFLKYFDGERSIFRLEPFVLHVMIYGYSRLGKMVEAENIYKKYVLLNKDKYKIEPDIKMITSLISGYAQSGQVQEAMDIYEEYCVVPAAAEEHDFAEEAVHSKKRRRPHRLPLLTPSADTKIQLSACMKHLENWEHEEALEIQEKLKDWL